MPDKTGAKLETEFRKSTLRGLKEKAAFARPKGRRALQRPVLTSPFHFSPIDVKASASAVMRL
jgi:hypothetical protein